MYSYVVLHSIREFLRGHLLHYLPKKATSGYRQIAFLLFLPLPAIVTLVVTSQNQSRSIDVSIVGQSEQEQPFMMIADLDRQPILELLVANKSNERILLEALDLECGCRVRAIAQNLPTHIDPNAEVKVSVNFDIERNAFIPVDQRTASMAILAHPIVRDSDNKLWATSPSQIDIELTNSITTTRRKIRFSANSTARFTGISTQTIVLESLDDCTIESVGVDCSAPSLQDHLKADLDNNNVATLTLGDWAGADENGIAQLLVRAIHVNGDRALAKIPIEVEPLHSYALHPPVAVFDHTEPTTSVLVYLNEDLRTNPQKHLKLQRIDKNESFSVDTQEHQNGKSLVIKHVPDLRKDEDSQSGELRFTAVIVSQSAPAEPLPHADEIVVPYFLRRER